MTAINTVSTEYLMMLRLPPPIIDVGVFFLCQMIVYKTAVYIRLYLHRFFSMILDINIGILFPVSLLKPHCYCPISNLSLQRPLFGKTRLISAVILIIDLNIHLSSYCFVILISDLLRSSGI